MLRMLSAEIVSNKTQMCISYVLKITKSLSLPFWKVLTKLLYVEVIESTPSTFVQNIREWGYFGGVK